jgi:hypothetical protein
MRRERRREREEEATDPSKTTHQHLFFAEEIVAWVE